MKICFLTQYYPAYLNSFYLRHPHSENLTHSDQMEEIIEDGFDWISALLWRLKEMGHEVHVLITNARPLQRAWAIENGVEFNPSNWKFSIPFEQVKKISPDVFWVDSVFQYYGDYLSKIKQYCGCILAWTATGYPDNLDLSLIDCMLTSHTHFADEFRNKGLKSEILLPSFEPLILERISRENSKDIPISFVGGLSHTHSYRTEIISKLINETNLQVWGYRRSLSKRMFTDSSKFMYALSSAVRFQRMGDRHKGDAWGLDMYAILQRSAITLNVDGDLANNSSGNIRLFESTGCNTLLITNKTKNLESIFIQGKEVETYSNYDELLDKIKYYSTHHEEREIIAKAGQAKALSQHSSIQRSKEWLDIVSNYSSMS
jgi:spore maturation protein CgeB